MPDHVHIIFALEDKKNLSQVIQSLKRFTANKINEINSRKGAIWQEGYFDTCLRTDEELSIKLNYIYENPLRKGYVEDSADWPFSCIEINW